MYGYLSFLRTEGRHTMGDKFNKLLEARHRRERETALMALYGGLSDSVSYGGGDLHGLSMKFNAVECLMTLRADFPGGPMVAFIGGEDMASTFCKAMREAKGERLSWREDYYGGQSEGEEEE